ncbi:MAG TPA: SpoIIE family protein phosphatase [Acidimicrobiales bacterium]|nr:SpoIIE family protein phosphatase [Acidimicrobiales bacterium]
MESSAELTLGSGPDAVPRARRFVRSSLSEWPAELAADAELVVSELVTNAALHGQPPVALRLAVGDRVRIEVSDAGRSAPILLQQNTGAMTGRGLAMIAALAEGWGVEAGPEGGKTVWAELAVGGSPAVRPEQATADIDALLRSFPDIDDPGHGPLYTVRLGAVDTEMLVAAKAHIDNVVRELILVREGQATGGAAMAPEMARLVETVTDDFAEARAAIKRQAAAAAARGDDWTHLELRLPLSAAAAGERYLAALDQADRYARSARLLSLAPPHLHTVFRRWYVSSLVEQLRARARGEDPPPARPFRDVVGAEMERIPELHREASRLELLQRVNVELAGASSPQEMAALVADRAMEFPGVASIRVYLLSGEGTLRSVAWRGASTPGPDRYDEIALDADLPGAVVVRSGEPLLMHSLDEICARFPDLTGYYAGERALHQIPLAAGQQRFGLVAFSFVGGHMPEDSQVLFARSLAGALSQALERSRLATSDEEARQALAFLTDATQIMVTARDPTEVLERLVQHAVPRLGDWCAVYLADGAVLRRVAMAIEGYPEQADLLKSTPPLSLDVDVPHTRAYRTGEVQLIDHGVGRLLQYLYQGLDFAALGGDPDSGTGLCVPITLRGELIGVIGLTFLGSGRRLTPRVVETLSGLGTRAAIALDLAQSWKAQHQMVQSLVEALLPSQPPRTPGVEFAARYLPAGGDVAGDWWEAELVPDGTVLIGLGDAAGHGMDAVSHMCELRHGARALAAVEPSPAALLADLNRRLGGPDGGFATALYARLQPATGELRWASAGHLPPLLCRPDGTVTALDHRGGAPLGTPAAAGTDQILTLNPGDTLVLYSDGVIERRQASLDDGIRHLMATVADHCAGPLDGLADTIMTEHCQGPVDDCCLLLVRYTGTGGDR